MEAPPEVHSEALLEQAEACNSELAEDSHLEPEQADSHLEPAEAGSHLEPAEAGSHQAPAERSHQELGADTRHPVRRSPRRSRRQECQAVRTHLPSGRGTAPTQIRGSARR